MLTIPISQLVIDEPGNRLLVADSMNHRVLSVDLDSLATETIAGTGSPGYSGDGGDATEAQLYVPVGVEVTPDGGVLIADLENHAVRYVTPNGVIETIAGNLPGEEPVSVGHPLEFPISRPAGMAWSLEGDLLITERSGHRVLRYRNLADEL